MMKKWKLIVAIAAVALVLAACSTNETNNQGTGGSADSSSAAGGQSEQQADATSEDSIYPLTIASTITATQTEESGTIAFKDITFDAKPEKLVVFDFGFLDTLAALEVEGIVGIPKGSSLPAHLEAFAADEYASVGNLKTPLFEDIAALSPDVIFISSRQSVFYEELSEIAPVVYVGTAQDDYWNTFLASVDIAATLFDKRAEADAYLAKFDAALSEINTLAGSFDHILVTMYNEGNLSGFSTNSRFGYIYDVYGFTPVTDNIEASDHGSNFGFEAVLQFNPQVLLVVDRTAATGGQSNIQADIENEIIKRTIAYQNNNIVYLDGPLWYLSGGGLQSELAKIEEILAELK